MATTNLVSKTLGGILQQTGNGTPDHTSPIGSQYTDQDTGSFYINTDGATAWGSVGEARTNYVLVKSVSDLPTPSGGVITLDASTLYEINGTIVITDRIDLNNAYLYGGDSFEDKIVKTNAGEIFTGAKGGTIKQLTLVNGDVLGKIFDLDDTVGDQQLVVRDCIVANSTEVGDIEGYFTTFFDVINFSGNSDGIQFIDIEHCFVNNLAFLSNNSGTFVTLTGAFEAIEILGGYYHHTSANSSTAFDVSGVTSISEAAELKSALTVGDGTVVNGTFSGDWEVEASGVNSEGDAYSVGDLYISIASATTISTVNTPVKLSGTTTSVVLDRFTMPSDNRLTYTGNRTRNFDVKASLSVTGGNNQLYSVYVAKNGSVVGSSRQQLKTTVGSDVRPISINTVVSMATNDYVEIWIENNTSDQDVTAEFMNFEIE